MVAERAEGNRRIYHLEDGGVRAVQDYLEGVWGEAAARLRLLAENTAHPRRHDDPIADQLRLDCPPQPAFAVWTSKIAPGGARPHRESGSRSSRPRESGSGGRIRERTAAGERHGWGDATVWEPPRRLAYLWHIGRGRDTATEVEITFVGTGTNERARTSR